LNLVGGEKIVITTDECREFILCRFETMLIPAATGKFKIRNIGTGFCRLILVYVKPGAGKDTALNNPVS